jgi:hypothetical protein
MSGFPLQIAVNHYMTKSKGQREERFSAKPKELFAHHVASRRQFAERFSAQPKEVLRADVCGVLHEYQSSN